MSRYTLAVLMVAGLVWQAMSPVAKAQETLADVIERSEQSVIKIVVEGKAGMSLGSGFVVDPSGIFVTNVHVLAGAQKATATFPNGTSTEVKGTFRFDPNRDICIAKIDGEAAYPVLGLAAALPRKGEQVTALGSPQGLSFSATTGVVSAIRPFEELGPEIGRPEIKGTWIQVDAALSGGNSGGPLINARGDVVGMSTLASQGSAQNLNFGISVIDIDQLVKESKSQPLVPLPDGIGKIESEHGGGGSGPEEMKRPPIPNDKLATYVEESQAGFDSLVAEVRQELSRNNEVMREMKKGSNFIPGNVQAEIVREIDPRSNKTKYYFRSQAVKNREVARLQQRLDDLKAIVKLVNDKKTKDSKETLHKLLSKSGPRLDPRREGSIGFMTDATVLVAFNKNGVIILYDGAPYLLWVETAAGLFTGGDVTPSPVFVAGTETVQIPGETPQVVTVLYTVKESELKRAIFGEEQQLAGGGGTPPPAGNSPNVAKEEWRSWKDNSGKFEIEATLVEVTKDSVILKKRDGKKITVPISRLSPADRKFIGKK